LFEKKYGQGGDDGRVKPGPRLVAGRALGDGQSQLLDDRSPAGLPPENDSRVDVEDGDYHNDDR